MTDTVSNRPQTDTVDTAENSWADPQASVMRERHRAVVADYMSRKGESRRTRYQLFTENGSGGLHTADTPGPLVTHGREALREHGAWSLQCFPDWEWTNVEIHGTDDPNRFWVECDGEGAIVFPGYPEGHYRNHFIHSFVLEDGKILENREFMNPFRQLEALGIEVPRIVRKGLPA